MVRALLSILCFLEIAQVVKRAWLSIFCVCGRVVIRTWSSIYVLVDFVIRLWSAIPDAWVCVSWTCGDADVVVNLVFRAFLSRG